MSPRQPKVDPRVQMLIQDIKKDAEQYIGFMNSQHSNKTEVERARIQYESCVEVLRKITDIFELERDAIIGLSQLQTKLTKEMQYEGPRSRFAYTSNSLLTQNSYIYGFYFHVGRHQYRAFYQWSQNKWKQAAIAKENSSGRLTKGTSISDSDKRKYWDFLYAQDDVKDKLQRSKVLLSNISTVTEFDDINIIRPVKNEWMGAGYGSGFVFTLPNFQYEFTFIIGEYEYVGTELQVSGEGFYGVDVTPLLKSSVEGQKALEKLRSKVELYLSKGK